MDIYLNTEEANMEIQLYGDNIEDWFFVNERCISDYENSFEIDGGTIIYKKSCYEVEVYISVDNNTQRYYYNKIVSAIKHLLDAIIYKTVYSHNKEQEEYMKEFIKRFKEFKGE